MIQNLGQRHARQIIEVVGSIGNPPEWGVQFFSAGIDEYLRVLEEEYLDGLLDYGSAFKVVVGDYGYGKTHFLYSVRELAWKHQYLVSYCPLSLNESPFFKLERVYRAIVANIMRPLTPDELFAGAERGIQAFLKSAYADLLEEAGAEAESREDALERVQSVVASAVSDLENPSVARALKVAMDALAEADEDRFHLAIQYLLVDGFDAHTHKSLGIMQAIDRGQALTAWRSLVQFIRNLNYRGLVVLFDEAEETGAMSSRQKEQLLANVREVVDECHKGSLRNVLVLYAVPKIEFLTEGHTPAYEALQQRIGTVLEVRDLPNPSGVQIKLDMLPQDRYSQLVEIGRKLADVYETAYAIAFPEEKKLKLASALAEAASDFRFEERGYRRLFVQGMVRALYALRANPAMRIEEAASRMLTQGQTELSEDSDSDSDDPGDRDF